MYLEQIPSFEAEFKALKAYPAAVEAFLKPLHKPDPTTAWYWQRSTYDALENKVEVFKKVSLAAS